MEKLKRLFAWCRRYLTLTLMVWVLFVAYAMFFSDNSFSKSVEFNNVIDSLTTEINTNRDTMLHYQQLNRRLCTERGTMERVAREQYNMNRINEDVYVFE